MKASLRFSTRRRLSPAQLEELYAHAWWTRGRRRPGIASVIKHSDLLASAWSGRQLVGFARVSTDFAYRAVLWDVIVHTQWQRRGLGTRLVRAVLADRRLKGVESFWLYTTDKQAFYRRLGFRAYPRHVMVWRRRSPGLR